MRRASIRRELTWTPAVPRARHVTLKCVQKSASRDTQGSFAEARRTGTNMCLSMFTPPAAPSSQPSMAAETSRCESQYLIICNILICIAVALRCPCTTGMMSQNKIDRIFQSFEDEDVSLIEIVCAVIPPSSNSVIVTEHIRTQRQGL
jgi:hypothetical protein